MKKLLTTLTLALALNAPAQADEDHEYCTQLSELGYQIMRGHQHRVPMSTAMEKLGHIEAARIMIQMAYDEPRYSTPEYREREQADFRDEVYLICIKGRKDE